MMIRGFGLILLVACLARAEGPDTAAADALNAEGVELFKAKEFAKAADKYREALAAYGAALGKEDADYLATAVTLHRATAWCEAQSGDIDGLAQEFAAFYDADLALGGSQKDESEIRNCLWYALSEAAHRKAIPEMDKIHAPFCEALQKTIARAQTDPRGEQLAPLLERLDHADAGTQCAWFESLCIAGETKRAAEAYARAVAFWTERSDFLNAAWMPHNAFYDIAGEGQLELTGPFVVDTLAAIRQHDLPTVEATLALNLREALAKAQPEAAVTFLEDVLERGTKAKALTPGLDEPYLRLCLDGFLTTPEAAAKRLRNAEALSALAKAAGDHHVEAIAARSAGEALAALGKTDDAVARLDEGAKLAEGFGDLLTLGEAQLAKGRVLATAGKRDAAEGALRASVDTFVKAEDGVAAIGARTAGLENARAKKDDALVAHYEEELSTVGAAGGKGGHSIGDMEPEELLRRLHASPKTFDMMEVSRDGERLAFKNLLDGTVVYDDIAFPFHSVNVSGILFQLRGADILVENFYDGRGSPGAKGDIAMSMGGRVHASHGSDFVPFGRRLFVEVGARIRVNSAQQIYRAKE